MTRIYLLAALLACGACSTSNTVAPQAQPATPQPAAASSTPDTNAGGDTIEARLLLEKIPPGTAPTPLQPRYLDRAALMAALQAIHPPYAVELDGKIIWRGVAPPASYRTAGDGSVSR